MADKEIGDLTAAATLDGTELALITQGANSRKATVAEIASQAGLACNGRLTLESGVPISTTDQSAKSTIYFTPFRGNRIWLYNGTVWKPYVLSEISVATSGGTASRPHDVFVYDNSGTLTLDLVAWTDATTRATALATQDGIYVKSGATTHRYVGTVYLEGAKNCTDAKALRYMWNYYNRVRRPLDQHDSTDSWSYSGSTLRAANNSTANAIQVMVGVAEDVVEIWHQALATHDTATGTIICGIGLDSTTTLALDSRASIVNSPVASVDIELLSSYCAIPSAGYHKYTRLEAGGGGGTLTWYGDGGGTVRRTGMFGSVMA